MSRLERLLPDTWQGPGREARWRRSRGRRVVAAVVAAAAVLVGWSALAPRAAATRSVVVAAHDLPAGHRLSKADLTAASWPASVRLPGAVTARDAVGQVLTAPVDRGEPVTDSRLRAARSWQGAADGQVLVSVPVGSSAAAGIARPGDHIDVFAAGRRDPVGSDLLVVSGAHTAYDSGSGSLIAAQTDRSTPTVLVACSPTTAGDIAEAAQSSPGSRTTLMVALHPQP